jgi:hypothetical protein
VFVLYTIEIAAKHNYCLCSLVASTPNRNLKSIPRARGRVVRVLHPFESRRQCECKPNVTRLRRHIGTQKEEDVDATHSREKRTYTHLQTHAHTSTYLGDGHGHRQGVFWRTAHAVARQSSRLCGGFMYRRCSF